MYLIKNHNFFSVLYGDDTYKIYEYIAEGANSNRKILRYLVPYGIVIAITS
ncbi:MAG: hypothetical protein QXU98_05860 [Candidatus Parvarchaeota archaeon]